MTYKTGEWGEQAKARSKTRLEYFMKRASSLRTPPHSVAYKGEVWALSFLKGARWLRGKYDIEWRGFRIDVKTSKPMVVGRGKYRDKYQAWRFNLYRQRKGVDFFLLLCMNELEEVVKVYLVPDHAIQRNNIGISLGRTYKWEPYRVELR